MLFELTSQNPAKIEAVDNNSIIRIKMSKFVIVINKTRE